MQGSGATPDFIGATDPGRPVCLQALRRHWCGRSCLRLSLLEGARPASLRLGQQHSQRRQHAPTAPAMHRHFHARNHGRRVLAGALHDGDDAGYRRRVIVTTSPCSTARNSSGNRVFASQDVTVGMA